MNLCEYIRRRAVAIMVLCMSSLCIVAQSRQYDVVIIGGGASGVAAGIQSARMGVETLIAEETPWLGGMLTAAGVSAVDGDYRLPSGVWGEFKAAVIAHYGGSPKNVITGWVSNVMYQPVVGDSIFKAFVGREKHLSVNYGTRLTGAVKQADGWLLSLQNLNSLKEFTIKAKMMIDATELGDVAKLCGVKYDVGMESRAVTHEDIAPEKPNGIIQDLTYVAILKDYHRDVAMAQPDGYNPQDFACSCANRLCDSLSTVQPLHSPAKMLSYGKLPGDEYMINWPICGNDFYANVIDLTLAQRERLLAEAKRHTLCFVYFMQHELGFRSLGLSDTEFPTADKLPFMPYYRESRRIHGVVRFTLNDVTDMYGNNLYRTDIAVGDYPVDHHHHKYMGDDELPDLHFHAIPSYGLPLGVMIPRDCDNLVVAEKSISVSNIINGTTRLQPVVLQVGQAAGALAALAVKGAKPISRVSPRDVQNALLAAGGYLLPYLDVDKEDMAFKPLQRIGATGILRGAGRNVGWANETWIRANEPLKANELQGMYQYYPTLSSLVNGDTVQVTLRGALKIISVAAASNIEARAHEILRRYHYDDTDDARPVLRKEFAVLVDEILNPFDRVEIDIYGNLIK